MRQEGKCKFGDVHRCGKWMPGECAKMERVTSTLEKGFVCKLYLMQRKELWNQLKKYYFFARLTL